MSRASARSWSSARTAQNAARSRATEHRSALEGMSSRSGRRASRMTSSTIRSSRSTSARSLSVESATGRESASRRRAATGVRSRCARSATSSRSRFSSSTTRLARRFRAVPALSISLMSLAGTRAVRSPPASCSAVAPSSRDGPQEAAGEQQAQPHGQRQQAEPEGQEPQLCGTHSAGQLLVGHVDPKDRLAVVRVDGDEEVATTVCLGEEGALVPGELDLAVQGPGRTYDRVVGQVDGCREPGLLGEGIDELRQGLRRDDRDPRDQRLDLQDHLALGSVDCEGPDVDHERDQERHQDDRGRGQQGQQDAAAHRVTAPPASRPRPAQCAGSAAPGRSRPTCGGATTGGRPRSSPHRRTTRARPRPGARAW